MPNILITGMSGLIGSAVAKRLRNKYTLSALNRGPTPGFNTFQADVANFDAIQPAFVGQNVVVHLAGSKGGE